MNSSFPLNAINQNPISFLMINLISLETYQFFVILLCNDSFYKNRNDLAISVIYWQSHVRIFECVLSWFYVFLKEMTRITKSISSPIWNEPDRMDTRAWYRMNKMKWSLNRTIHFFISIFLSTLPFHYKLEQHKDSNSNTSI